jgi:hypothetical protein
MKKAIIFTLLLVLSISSLAAQLTNRSIFFEGTSVLPDHRMFFLNNFAMEAGALGYPVATNKAEAGYIFRFNVQRYSDPNDPSIQFIILVTLLLREGEVELVSFGWPYAQLDDMYEYNQFVFFKAAVLIPAPSDAELAVLQAPDTGWQNKWLYVRASIDYPIVFYGLQGTDLYKGMAVYDGDPTDPTFPLGPDDRLVKLENIVLPSPGLTLGVEVQFVNFMSFELNFQMTLGDPKTYFSFNLAAGAELKYIHKTDNFMISPYLALSYPINKSSEFSEFPLFAFGGGVQLGVRGSCSGAFFLNVNYMMSLTNAVRHNPYRTLDGYDWAPEPPVIHYNRFVIGLAIGYKHGFFDRGK